MNVRSLFLKLGKTAAKKRLFLQPDSSLVTNSCYANCIVMVAATNEVQMNVSFSAITRHVKKSTLEQVRYMQIVK